MSGASERYRGPEKNSVSCYVTYTTASALFGAPREEGGRGGAAGGRGVFFLLSGLTTFSARLYGVQSRSPSDRIKSTRPVQREYAGRNREKRASERRRGIPQRHSHTSHDVTRRRIRQARLLLGIGRMSGMRSHRRATSSQSADRVLSHRALIAHA